MLRNSDRIDDLLDKVLGHIDENLDRNIETLFELLSYSSVSTDAAFSDDCRQAADWLDGQLRQLGFSSSVRETRGKPVVLAHWPVERRVVDEPSVLFYGHYDVQPPDPLELWQSPPFEPRLVKAKSGHSHITARGVADNKGQLMTFIEACRAWIEQTGRLPVPVTVLIEGEEEIGSPSLGDFLSSNRAELNSNVVLVCDTLMWKRDTPAVTTRLRGMVSDELEIRAADCDLHSGLYGNAARNPIKVLADILGRIVDTDGRVRIRGFYDDVVRLPEAVRAQWRELDFDESRFLGSVGLQYAAGESDYSALEQIWGRPSFDVCGIHGGYTGSGFKTVIPACASAKISFRLVPRQSPERVREAFRAFVEERLPEDCTVHFTAHGQANPLTLGEANPYVDLTQIALDEEFSEKSVQIGCGASIPIVEMFRNELGLDCVLTGFALEDDCIHSPNEKYLVSSFKGGTRFWARLLLGLEQHNAAHDKTSNRSGSSRVAGPHPTGD